MRIASSLLAHRNLLSSSACRRLSSLPSTKSLSSVSCPTFQRAVKPSISLTSRAFSSSSSPESLNAGAPSSSSIFKVAELNNAEFVSAQGLLDREVVLQGWIRTVRAQKHFSFLEINDGSALKSIQVVVDSTVDDYAQFLPQLSTGASVEIRGNVKETPKGGREIHATQLRVLGVCPPEEYPLQKKKHSLEFLRSISHLRGRTNTFNALARIRSQISFATHEFYNQKSFVYVQTPLITSSDCEGAGEMFRVTTLPLDNMLKAQQPGAKEETPVKTNENKKKKEEKKEENLFKEDFFGKPTYLTVSGQLSLETYACALNDVYCFGPTFRAEKSQTSRHLAEFHMIEAELAFSDKERAMDNAEALLKHVVTSLRTRCPDELAFFDQFYNGGKLGERLDTLLGQRFPRITYEEAVSLVQAEIKKGGRTWAYPDLKYGDDLQSEHERWLAEEHFSSCVFITNYPQSLKPFYMKQSLTHPGTVENFDMLVPGVGELVGGSAREEDLDTLRQKIQQFGLSEESYSWYLDLRKFGTVPHAGYGVGFERLVCYLSGMENIRDAIAFPRFTNYAEF